MLKDACTLCADEFEARLEILRRDFLPHVLSSEALEDGHVFEFDLSMREELERLVAFERQCCPDLHWILRQEGDRMRLEIRGLAEELLVE